MKETGIPKKLAGKGREAGSFLATIVYIALHNSKHLPFIKMAPGRADIKIVDGTALKQHFGGRTTIKALEAAFTRLVHWGLIIDYSSFNRMFVIRTNWPDGWRPDLADIERQAYSVPMFFAHPTSRKAKLTDNAIRRMISEQKD
jgi:hypothetical protein